MEPLEARRLLSNALAPQPASSATAFLTAANAEDSRPQITATRPAAGDTNVARDAFIAADINIPTAGAGIDTGTISSSTVRLFRTSNNQVVAAVVNTSGGGDALVLQPQDLLEPDTQYTFQVTSGLKDVAGNSFIPFSMSFTTGTHGGESDEDVTFEKITLKTAQQQSFSGVTIGPDRRLYATTLSGHIFRFDIRPNGHLSDPTIIYSVRKANGGARFITGIAFDPWSTHDNLVAWISHGQNAYEGAEDYTGKISELSGPTLENYRDFVVGLPRSIRDHMNNQPVFGPDGKLYFAQGSNTAMGAPDNAWGLREEHPLNGAVLTLDHRAVRQRLRDGQGPLNVGPSYSPFATGAPLALYATGVRNAFDLLWHSNGKMYATNNGSAAGGNTPATPTAPFSINRIDSDRNGPYTGPQVPGIKNVRQTQADYLLQVVSGGYYGHPNPARGEFVLNGGNPTSGVDADEVPAYPVGTKPDRNYRGNAFKFGMNYSPNGLIEYQSNAFNGKLKGKILVARYSGGDDILALQPGNGGAIVGTMPHINGLSHFVDPLDLVEDTRSGNIYVVEHGAGRITLLRPATPAAIIATNTGRRIFSDVRGGDPSPTRRITVTNQGNVPLVIPAGGLSLAGTDANQFIIAAPSTEGSISIQPGASLNVSVAFHPRSSTSPGIKNATLRIQSNDQATPVRNVRLRGLATTGEGGTHEPSLARILQLYEIPINVGDSDPSQTFLTIPSGASTDEVTMQRMVKAGPGAVTIEPLAVYGVAGHPTAQFGFYQSGSEQTIKEVLSVAAGDAQTVNPFFNGAASFDAPGEFALFATFPPFKNSDNSSRVVYSEDALNRWETIVANRRKMRFYPLKNGDGSVVPNAYVVAVEEFTRDYDFQDVVAIIRNVKPVGNGARLGLFNRDTVPFHDRLVFNRIQNLDTSVPNVVHDTTRLRLDNTGTSTLAVSNLAISGPFQLVDTPTSFTIGAGASRDVVVRFTATSGSIHNGTLMITSNAAENPVRVVQLAGYWQSHSESSGGISREPTLQQIAQAFGYTTAFTYGNENLDTGGKVQAVGDEIISAYWRPAEISKPVTVVQLAAFHSQGQTATISYFAKGSVPNPQKIFQHRGEDGQSFLPRIDSTGRFYASGRFGFKVDSEWSDPTKNQQEQPGGNYGHHFRFFPARDRNGHYIPNTYIVAMDYRGINYDYNDNVYLISNITPDGVLPAPSGATAIGSTVGIQLRWAQNSESNFAGYHVFRAMFGTSRYTRITKGLLSAPEYLDTEPAADRTWHYRIVAVDTAGVASTPVTVSAYRPLA